jgi:signal transduction histidine kinase
VFFNNLKIYTQLAERRTGIGLLLCKEFIDMHQGKIWVEREVGKGSVFHITINL